MYVYIPCFSYESQMAQSQIGAIGFVIGTLYQFLSQIGVKGRNRAKCIKRLIEIKENRSMWIHGTIFRYFYEAFYGTKEISRGTIQNEVRSSDTRSRMFNEIHVIFS